MSESLNYEMVHDPVACKTHLSKVMLHPPQAQSYCIPFFLDFNGRGS